MTERTIGDLDALERELDQVRRRGYATAMGELEPGLVAIAAPVIGVDGRAIAAVSISGPDFRLTAERIDRFAPLLVEETRRLSAQLGFR